MISVEEAKRIVMAQVKVRTGEYQRLEDAYGQVLAEDVHAPHPHPLFDMSAVDGFAVGDANGPWKQVGAIAAGEVLGTSLDPGLCARIFTGAEVPPDSFAVLMQEHCTSEGGLVQLERGRAIAGSNIRRKAEQCKAGDLLLSKGARLDPDAIGYLASCGVQDVVVAKGISVRVVRTGGEFTTGDDPQPGRIFSSNEWMLIAALRQSGSNTENEVLLANDTEQELRAALVQAAKDTDVVITTGGASVGDHDLILPVLKKLGATIQFHGIAQKPGKPMLFATLGTVPVFALPGNPRAVMVCFWEYVLPFLRAMQGAKDPWLSSDILPITHVLSAKGDRAEFRAAQVKGGKVTLPADEGSHMLRSLIDANALAYLPATQRAWKEGDTIVVHYIPGR
jgi:molybdopterin molybdotransferase